MSRGGAGAHGAIIPVLALVHAIHTGKKTPDASRGRVAGPEAGRGRTYLAACGAAGVGIACSSFISRAGSIIGMAAAGAVGMVIIWPQGP